eukprot:TRINITY_DN14869_c0_g1_i1.p1 TRINITY_DN14869_c0_g1~~TRINITY_DN14869_c0_g1_i1.p1  ORF type:complete len:724 (-),score=103.23 TRINITY_DN14869_c0_g1_i1:43-2214(-)
MTRADNRLSLFCRIWILLGIYTLCKAVPTTPTTDKLTNDVWQTQVSWNGGKPPRQNDCRSTCPHIMTPSGDFACSDGNGNWDGGQGTFIPQLPPSTRAIQMIVDIEYSVYCPPGMQIPGELLVLIQGKEVGSLQLEPNDLCSCYTCMQNATLISMMELVNGWPNFNYTGSNTVLLSPSNAIFCLSKVTVYVRYEYDYASVVITNLFPNLGPSTGGTSVTVYGYNFYAGLSCIYGGGLTQPASNITQARLVCTTPPGSGCTSIGLGGHHALTAGPTLPFLYYEDPVIDSISPSSISQGSAGIVTIQGRNFIDSAYLYCRFGDVVASGTFINSSRIECPIPSSVGVVNLSISLNGQQYVNNVLFTFVDAAAADQTRDWFILAFCLLMAIILMMVLFLWSRKKQVSEPIPLATDTPPLQEYKTMEIDFNDVKLGRRIGRGSAGDVFAGLWHGSDVAVKVIPIQALSKDMASETILQEASLLKSLRHPNILQYMGACAQPNYVCIITEYMPLGSIYQLLHNEKVSFPWSRIRSVCIDAGKGLAYLHNSSPPIIHRDFKSHNLLVDRGWKVKVSDFGLSRIVDMKNTMTACGTPCWTAPEVIRRQHYSEKADIYSLGMVMWELVTRQDPFKGMEAFHVVFAVGNHGLRPEIPGSIPDVMRELITDCWQEEDHLRPTVEQVLSRLEAWHEYDNPINLRASIEPVMAHSNPINSLPHDLFISDAQPLLKF